jgi:hypothetical protein
MRLEVLKKELEAGQVALQKVEEKRAYLHETMLRISDPIQALEELLAEQQPAEHDGSGSPPRTARHRPGRRSQRPADRKQLI